MLTIWQRWFYWPWQLLPLMSGPPTGPPVNVFVAMATMKVAIISWSPQPSYYSCGDDSHKYKVSILEKGFSVTQVFDVDKETSMKFKDFTISSTYCVSLLAVNSFGEGPWSDCVTFKAASGILAQQFQNKSNNNKTRNQDKPSNMNKTKILIHTRKYLNAGGL